MFVCVSVCLSVCLTVCLFVAPAAIGVRGTDEQQKLGSVPRTLDVFNLYKEKARMLNTFRTIGILWNYRSEINYCLSKYCNWRSIIILNYLIDDRNKEMEQKINRRLWNLLLEPSVYRNQSWIRLKMTIIWWLGDKKVRPIHLSACVYVSLSVYLSVYLCLCICLCLCACVCVSNFQFAYLSVYCYSSLSFYVYILYSYLFL